MKLAPTLEGLRVYPFVRLTDAKRRLQAAGVDVIDFGIGEPREETPAFIREALAAAVEPMSAYPAAEGLPELRASIAAWTARRFGVALDPATQVLPTLGSKEAVFHLAQVVDGDTVALTSPGSPLAECVGTVLAVDSAEDAELYMPMASRIAHLAMLDVLAVGVAVRLGVAQQDRLRRIKEALAETRVPRRRRQDA